jgi:hypothetical protein
MPQDPKILWPLIGSMIVAGLALIGTFYTAIKGHSSRKEQDRFKAVTDERLATLNAQLVAERDERLAHREAEKIVSKFRDPLLHAAYDLQSRIYNILSRDFLTRYYTDGSQREQEYAVENTVFLLSQFLGWTELVRQEIQFLDLGRADQTRKLRELQDSMYTQLHDDSLGTGFRLFPGEQRAVGELMIDRTGVIPRCLGFATFLNNRPAEIDRWLNPLRDDIRRMPSDLEPFKQRLIQIQRSLIDLLEFLDPECIWSPASHRTRLSAEVDIRC